MQYSSPPPTTLPDSIGSSQSKGTNRGSWIDAGACGERTAIDDEKVLDVVRLIPGVDHRCFRVAAHARRAHQVSKWTDHAVIENLDGAGGLEELAGPGRAMR